jgi:DNA-binding NarL/FixJ family response regulator
MQIIIVEDDSLVALNIADVLTNAGYNVVGLACDLNSTLKLQQSISRSWH